MIFYSIIPHEAVFTGDDEHAEAQMPITINGVQLIVQPYSDQEWQVVRLISSNPSDFLNEKYQPGQLISLKPFFQ